MRAVTTNRRLGRSLPGAFAVAALLSAAPPVYAQEQSHPVQLEADRIKDQALWTGVRLGVFFPAGDLYADRTLVTTPFRDVATNGPALELDIGARFVHHFIGYVFLEDALLGRGNNVAWTVPHGGQSSQSTQALGIGLRWESNPDGLGFAVDVGGAYRWFSARWADATTVRMEGLSEIRLGLGASWRVTHLLALAPMVTLSTGRFTERTLDGQMLGDLTSSYAAASLCLSGHVDL
jgi:hypothetical protein